LATSISLQASAPESNPSLSLAVWVVQCG